MSGAERILWTTAILLAFAWFAVCVPASVCVERAYNLRITPPESVRYWPGLPLG